MSEGFKNFAAIIIGLSVIGTVIGFAGGFPYLLYISLAWILISISLFICSGFCKILEDTRDSLKNIENLLKETLLKEE